MILNKNLALATTLALTFALSACGSNSETPQNVLPKKVEKSSSKIDTKQPVVVLKTTAGDLTITLFPDIAPLAVENFMTHIEQGYYDHIAFHRIIKGFMIQGGDPTETGRGGESIWHKDFKDEFRDKTFNKPGILAMANRGPATNGSQFFITTAKTPWLNGHHTIFGEITPDSYSVLEKLDNTPVNGSVPRSRVEIVKAFIKSKGE
jgi:peptidylprolyl isomerase